MKKIKNELREWLKPIRWEMIAIGIVVPIFHLIMSASKRDPLKYTAYVIALWLVWTTCYAAFYGRD